MLNTSNKSEAAVGYGTLYGDMCGGLSVLGDVYKTEVFELADTSIKMLRLYLKILSQNHLQLNFDQTKKILIPCRIILF